MLLRQLSEVFSKLCFTVPGDWPITPLVAAGNMANTANDLQRFFVVGLCQVADLTAEIIRSGFLLIGLFFYIVNMEEMRRRRFANFTVTVANAIHVLSHGQHLDLSGCELCNEQTVYITHIYDAGMSSCCWMSQMCL